MLINRLMLIGKTHMKVFQQIARVSFKKSIKFIIKFSFVLSIVTVFKYEINAYYNESLDYPVIRSIDPKNELNFMYLFAILLFNVLNYFITHLKTNKVYKLN